VQRKDNLIYGVMFKVVVQSNSSMAKEIGDDRLRWNKFQTHCIGSLDHNRHILAKAKRRIAGPDVTSPEDIRDILIDAVVESSQVDPGIGSDVMGVVVDKIGNKIDTYFKPANPDTQALLAAQVSGSEGLRDRLSVATPYLLAPGVIYGPSVSPGGGWPMNSGITFNFSGFDTGNGSPDGGVYFGAHPRRPPPGR
jgi:hypothetical protein